MSNPPPPIEYATPSPRRRPGVLWWLIPLIVVLVLLLMVAAYLLVGTQVRVVVTKTATPVMPLPFVAPTAPQQITVVQRRQTMLAGTSGSVFVHIGDITGGRTLLTIQDSLGRPMMPTWSVQEGDVNTFPVAGNTFEIAVIELRNHLTGDDYGVFEIRKPGSAPATTQGSNVLQSGVAK